MNNADSVNPEPLIRTESPEIQHIRRRRNSAVSPLNRSRSSSRSRSNSRCYSMDQQNIAPNSSDPRIKLRFFSPKPQIRQNIQGVNQIHLASNSSSVSVSTQCITNCAHDYFFSMAADKSPELLGSQNVVPEFDPSSKSQNIENWLHKVNEIASIYGWSDKQIIHYMTPKLVGNAKRWYDGLTTIKYNWNEWQEKLKAAFPAFENYGLMLKEMLDKRAKLGDCLEDYYYEKIDLLNRCDIQGKKALDCIIFGIDDLPIRLGAKAAQFQDQDKLLAYLRNADNVNRLHKFQTTTNDFSKASCYRPNIRCFNCKTMGHVMKHCPHPLKVCDNCSMIGHIASECDAISES